MNKGKKILKMGLQLSIIGRKTDSPEANIHEESHSNYRTTATENHPEIIEATNTNAREQLIPDKLKILFRDQKGYRSMTDNKVSDWLTKNRNHVNSIPTDLTEIPDNIWAPNDVTSTTINGKTSTSNESSPRVVVNHSGHNAAFYLMDTETGSRQFDSEDVVPYNVQKYHSYHPMLNMRHLKTSQHKPGLPVCSPHAGLIAAQKTQENLQPGGRCKASENCASNACTQRVFEGCQTIMEHVARVQPKLQTVCNAPPPAKNVAYEHPCNCRRQPKSHTQTVKTNQFSAEQNGGVLNPAAALTSTRRFHARVFAPPILSTSRGGPGHMSSVYHMGRKNKLLLDMPLTFHRSLSTSVQQLTSSPHQSRMPSNSRCRGGALMALDNENQLMPVISTDVSLPTTSSAAPALASAPLRTTSPPESSAVALHQRKVIAQHAPVEPAPPGGHKARSQSTDWRTPYGLKRLQNASNNTLSASSTGDNSFEQLSSSVYNSQSSSYLYSTSTTLDSGTTADYRLKKSPLIRANGH